MKLILTSDVEGVGKVRDVIDVKSGYANFLLRGKLAVNATTENMKKLEAELAELARIEAENKAKAIKIRDEIKGKTVKLFAKAGPEGRLYGAVTTADIAEAIKSETGHEIDKRKIDSPNIKEEGIFDIKVKLYTNVEAALKVDVKRK